MTNSKRKHQSCKKFTFQQIVRLYTESLFHKVGVLIKYTVTVSQTYVDRSKRTIGRMSFIVQERQT